MDFDSLVPDAPQAPVGQNQGQALPDFDSLQDDSEKYGTPGQIAKTAIEQGLSGATLGASKVAETHLLGVKPEDIAGREQENPVTSTLSNIAGTGAMLYGTGGLGGLAEGAGAAAKIGVSALEGATIGGVNQATDAWSQDKELDAGKIAASAGIGALIGGGGHALLETIGEAPKAIEWAKQFIPKSENNVDTWSNNILRAYEVAGEDKNQFIGDYVKNVNSLRNTAEASADDMYKVGNKRLEKAINEELPIEKAKTNAFEAINNIKSLIAPTGEEESMLSRNNINILDDSLANLSQKIGDATKSSDIHSALSEFATDFDSNIKFDKIPTAAQQGEQEVLRDIRGSLRGNLKDPNIWGESGSIYGQTSELYANYMNADKNFKRDFMKPRISSNGTTIRVVDPTKVKSYFNNIQEPNQALRLDTMNDFINSATDMSEYRTNQNEASKITEELTKELMNQEKNMADLQVKGNILNTIKGIKKGHEPGIGTFALLESLPLPTSVKATALALQRYAGKEGGYMLGGDLARAVNTAKALTKHAQEASEKIDGKARLIFSGSSSQARKVEP